MPKRKREGGEEDGGGTVSAATPGDAPPESDRNGNPAKNGIPYGESLLSVLSHYIYMYIIICTLIHINGSAFISSLRWMLPFFNSSLQ